MARVNNLSNFLTDVANAIKTKKGSETVIPAASFDTEILALPSQGTYEQRVLNISANGTQTITPSSGYDAIDELELTVAVPEKQLQSKTYSFTQNTNIQLLPDTGYEGFDTVTLNINVPSSQINNQNKTIIQNGSYVADSGYTGLGTVLVNVSQEGVKIFNSVEAMDNTVGEIDDLAVVNDITNDYLGLYQYTSETVNGMAFIPHKSSFTSTSSGLQYNKNTQKDKFINYSKARELVRNLIYELIGAYGSNTGIPQQYGYVAPPPYLPLIYIDGRYYFMAAVMDTDDNSPNPIKFIGYPNISYYNGDFKPCITVRQNWYYQNFSTMTDVISATLVVCEVDIDTQSVLSTNTYPMTKIDGGTPAANRKVAAFNISTDIFSGDDYCGIAVYSSSESTTTYRLIALWNYSTYNTTLNTSNVSIANSTNITIGEDNISYWKLLQNNRVNGMHVYKSEAELYNKPNEFAVIYGNRYRQLSKMDYSTYGGYYYIYQYGFIKYVTLNTPITSEHTFNVWYNNSTFEDNAYKRYVKITPTRMILSTDANYENIIVEYTGFDGKYYVGIFDDDLYNINSSTSNVPFYAPNTSTDIDGLNTFAAYVSPQKEIYTYFGGICKLVETNGEYSITYADINVDLQSKDLLTNKKGYGNNGVIVGDGSYYDYIDGTALLKKYYGISNIDLSEDGTSAIYKYSENHTFLLGGSSGSSVHHVKTVNGVVNNANIGFILDGEDIHAHLLDNDNVNVLYSTSGSTATGEIFSWKIWNNDTEYTHTVTCNVDEVVDVDWKICKDCVIISIARRDKLYVYKLTLSGVSTYTHNYSIPSAQSYGRKTGIVYDYITDTVYILKSGYTDAQTHYSIFKIIVSSFSTSILLNINPAGPSGYVYITSCGMGVVGTTIVSNCLYMDSNSNYMMQLFQYDFRTNTIILNKNGTSGKYSTNPISKYKRNCYGNVRFHKVGNYILSSNTHAYAIDISASANFVVDVPDDIDRPSVDYISMNTKDTISFTGLNVFTGEMQCLINGINYTLYLPTELVVNDTELGVYSEQLDLVPFDISTNGNIIFYNATKLGFKAEGLVCVDLQDDDETYDYTLFPSASANNKLYQQYVHIDHTINNVEEATNGESE